MADPKVGRVAFGPAGERSHRSDGVSGYIVEQRYGAAEPPIPSLSSRFVPQFEDDGGLIESVPVGAITDAINLAIRVGRGTATTKELSEALAPFGVRRKV